MLDQRRRRWINLKTTLGQYNIGPISMLGGEAPELDVCPLLPYFLITC